MRAHTKGKDEMGKRFAIVIGVAAAGVMALGAQTAAANAKTFKYTSKYTSASTANGYPSPGGTAELVGPSGSVNLKPGGDTGDLIDHLTITERLAPNKFAFKGKGIDNFGHGPGEQENSGKLRHTFKGTITVRADGSQQLAIEGHFTGGHVDFAPLDAGGRYRGASGHYSGTATVARRHPPRIAGGSKGKLRLQADAVADDPDQPAGVMALGAQTATSSTVGPVDSTPPEPTPELQLSGKKKQELGKAVKVKARCGDPEACTARTARARGFLHWLRRPNQSTHARLEPASADLGPGETTILKLKLTKKVRRRAANALEHFGSIDALIAVDATDADDGGAAKREIKIVK